MDPLQHILKTFSNCCKMSYTIYKGLTNDVRSNHPAIKLMNTDSNAFLRELPLIIHGFWKWFLSFCLPLLMIDHYKWERLLATNLQSLFCIYG